MIHSYHWENGRLNHKVHVMDCFDAAILFVETLICDAFKIFDLDGCLVHTGNGCPVDPYL